MRDFDSDSPLPLPVDERKFTVAGVQLVARPSGVAPETLRDWIETTGFRWDDAGQARRDLALLQDELATGMITAESAASRLGEIAAAIPVRHDLSESDYIARLDRTVEAMLDPDSIETWREARASTMRPVTLGQIHRVVNFLFEVQAGRPTQRPSVSSDGQQANGTVSTAGLLSPEPTPVI